jgi:hypothetical protein
VKKIPSTTKYDRFTNLVDKVLSVPKAEIDRRIEEEKPKPASSPSR